MNILGFFQRLGRVLQLPIAVLPVVALSLRFGQPDLSNAAFIAQAGSAIFDNLALIFATGVTSSWLKGGAGAAALVGVVGYSVLTKAIAAINPEINMSVLAGIITSPADDAAYNRWSDTKLPGFLSFFGGKRFVLITTGFSCPVLATIFGYVWPPVQHAIHVGGEWIISAGALGSGTFGFINRPLIPTGLHWILNTIAWFQVGESTNATGTVFHGDINRFYAGDGTAGTSMSGLFPTMMFGLPGAALAMYFVVPKERRPMVSGMLLSVAVTAFLTGVTEPLEFLFMFLIPLPYLLHALLAGISLFATMLLGIYVGFSFSAGAIDYALMYNLPAASQNVWILLVMGAIFLVIYFVVFSLVIRMFNLKTPGREDKKDEIVTEEANSNTEEGLTQLATSYIAAVGGAGNLKAIDACVVRLRFAVVDSTCVNDTMCKRLGVSGVVKLNKQITQVIVGAKVESISDTTKKVATRDPVAATSAEATPTAAAPVARPQAVPNAVSTVELISPITSDVMALDQASNEVFVNKAVGDGVTVRPIDKIVVLPVAGAIVKIFNTNHALCLETGKGAEIVVHMGIDTVALEGKDFKHPVEEGARVSVGRPILEMDLDYLNANARLMISPVARSNIDDFSGLITEAQGHIVAGQTPPYEIKE